MGTDKNNNQIAVIREAMAGMVQKAVTRWTAKSPKVYRNITNIAMVAGVAATVVQMIPFAYPIWVMPVTAFVIAVAAKFTVESK